MKYLRRLTLWDWLLVLVAVAFLCVVLFGMTGCTVGYDRDGNGFPCIRLDDAEPIVSGAKAVGGVVGTLIGGPAGGSLGTEIGALLGIAGTAFFAKRSTRARDAAFDEGVRRGAAVSTPRTADLPVAPA